jgi:hypothetical protein
VTKRAAWVTHSHQIITRELPPAQTQRDLKYSQIQREIDFRMPLVHTEQYWKRHGFTVEDILQLLQASSPVFVWHAGLMYNIAIPNAAVKDCAATSEAMNYGGKANGIDKLKQLLLTEFPSEQTQEVPTSVLLFQCADGVKMTSIQLEATHYPLPFHCISTEMYTSLHTQLLDSTHNDKPTRMWLGQRLKCYQQPLRWMNIYVIPYRLINSNPPCISVARVVPHDWYKQWFPNAPCLSDMRDMVEIDQRLWCVMDETFYVYVPR